MIHFLDFDRTLFDTDAYLASLPDEPGCAPFRDELIAALAKGRDETISGGAERQAVWDKVSSAIHAGTLSFAPGYLTRFMYKDVSEMLHMLANEAIIVSYGEKERQRVKIESALAGVVRLTVLYTGMETKATFLKTWPGYYGGPAILVDDRPSELEELAATFPNMRLLEMRRDGAAGDGRWPVIRSLSELP